MSGSKRDIRDPRRAAVHALTGLAGAVRGGGTAMTAGAPHARGGASVDALLLRFVAAVLAAIGVGCWSLGAASFAAMADDGLALGGWRGDFAVWLATDPATADWFESLTLGASYAAPLLVVAIVVAAGWEVLFATLRRRPTDPGWLMAACLFTALLPASTPLSAAALGLSFGLVFGSHVFGGTGRYLLSPALLGVVFLNLAYPGLFGADRWVPGLADGSTWSMLASTGVDGLGAAGTSWWEAFAGREVGALGTPSALTCTLGILALVASRTASWRTVVGAVIGVVLVSIAVNAGAESAAAQIPWRWHLATGSLAFGIAFVATDPTTMPLTKAGRWLHGALVGALAVLIRVVNPEHPEGTLLALVIASLFTPLLDHAAVAARLRLLQTGVRP